MRYSDIPRNEAGATADLQDPDGNLYRIHAHKNRVLIRTLKGGWRVHVEQPSEMLVCAFISRTLSLGAVWVHTNADGSTTPWPKPRTLNPDTSLVVAEEASVFGGEMNEAEVAAALSAQYRKANLATYEIVKFGAMVLSLEQALGHEMKRDESGRNVAESGLKGWLEEHCPEVNYKTIMRHKEVAKAIYRQYSQADSERTIEAFAQALQLDGSEDATAADLECSEAVKGLVFGKSARQLLFDFASRRSGRPVGSKSLEPYKPLSTAEAEEMATVELEGIVNDLASFFTRHMHLKITDAQRRKACRLRLLDLADLIK